MSADHSPDTTAWEHNDDALRAQAETPLVDLLRQAGTGDVESLNSLWLTFVKPAVLRKSKVVCSWISHRGAQCPGVSCDEALGSAVQAGAQRILGIKNDLKKSPHRSLMFRAVDALDAASMLSARGGSQLKYWCDTVDEVDHTSETWPKLVNVGLKRGRFLVDSRRQWNSTRGLVQRIDQVKYLDRESPHDSARVLADVFLEIWAGTVLRRLEEIGDDHVLGAVDFLRMRSPDRSTLKSLLVSIYDDACDNNFEDIGLDPERVKRHLVHVTSRDRGSIPEDLPSDDAITRAFTLIETCIELAYQRLGIEEPEERHLVAHISRARHVSRKLSRQGAALGDGADRIMYDYYGRFDDESDSVDDDFGLEDE